MSSRLTSRPGMDSSQLELYRRDYRLMVLMANAAMDDAVHVDFFATLFARLRGD